MEEILAYINVLLKPLFQINSYRKSFIEQNIYLKTIENLVVDFMANQKHLVE